MQPVNTRVVDVSNMLAHVPGVAIADSEAELVAKGHQCTMYTLGPHPQRYAVSLPALRANLVKSAENTSGLFVCDRMPAFRPCPVLCLKNLFLDELGDGAERCRVCWDVDTEDDGAQCTPVQLVDLFCGFLREHVSGCEDWDAEEVWVWYGSFADKRASYHIYFPRMVWGRRSQNAYKNQNFAALTEHLKPFGLKIDTSITTSGIKVLGADKWLHKGAKWRGDVQRLVYIRNGPPVELVTWKEAFEHCFAIASPGDVGHDREVNFREIPRVAGGEAVQKRNRVVEVVAAVEAGTPDARLYAAVPQWRGCKVKHVQKDNGVVFVVPQSTFCPLKHAASNDQPAFQHAGAGKTYVVRDVLGNQRVLCQVCIGKELSIPVPVVEMSDELTARIKQYFAGWAVFTPGYVLRLPDEHGDYQVVTDTQFKSHFKKDNMLVRVGKRDKSWAEIWLALPDIPTYGRGFIFDPASAPNPGYFNTYRGYRRDVAEAHVRRAPEFAAMNTQQLIAECPAWHQLVRFNICHDDVALFNYFHSWMADCVQNPTVRPGVALMLLGPPGCGKGLTLKAMLYIQGCHGQQTNNLATKWNAVFENKLYVFGDEAVLPKDKEGQSRLLALVTEDQQTTEGKGQNLRTTRNYARVVLASNRPKAVPLQPGERRYAIYGGDYVVHAKDSAEGYQFFEQVGAELADPDKLAALLEFWQRWSLAGVNLRNLPVTQACFRAQYSTFTDYERFVYHWLLSGNLCLREIPYDPQDGDHACLDALYAENARMHGHHEARTFATTGFNVWRCEHCAVPKFAFATAFTQFADVRNPEAPLWKFLGELKEHSTVELFRHKRIRVHERTHRPYVTELAPQEVWRAAFIKYRGGALDSRIWGDWAIHI